MTSAEKCHTAHQTNGDKEGSAEDPLAREVRTFFFKIRAVIQVERMGQHDGTRQAVFRFPDTKGLGRKRQTCFRHRTLLGVGSPWRMR